MPSPDFRSQLDSILRSKNTEAVRRFLVAQGQWPEDATMDVERAMWLMIAGSPALRDLHTQAHNWLIGHGAQAEVEILREREQAPQKPTARSSARAGGGPENPGSKKRRQNTGVSKQIPPKPGLDRSAQPRSKPQKQS